MNNIVDRRAIALTKVYDFLIWDVEGDTLESPSCHIVVCLDTVTSWALNRIGTVEI